MHLKYILFPIGFAALVLVLMPSSVFLQGPEPAKTTKEWEDPTTFSARAKKEKAKGVHRVTFPAPLVEYPDSISLETALAQATVVVADVIDKSSRLIDPSTIGTFYRVNIVETLSQASSSQCCPTNEDNFPKDLPPLKENEMYLAGIGGTIVLDEVELTVKEDFEGLVPHRRYLLFLSPTSPGKFGLVQVGPRGVFKIKPDGHLESIVDKPYELGRDIERSYANSLASFKEDIKKRNSAK